MTVSHQRWLCPTVQPRTKLTFSSSTLQILVYLFTPKYLQQHAVCLQLLRLSFPLLYHHHLLSIKQMGTRPSRQLRWKYPTDTSPKTPFLLFDGKKKSYPVHLKHYFWSDREMTLCDFSWCNRCKSLIMSHWCHWGFLGFVELKRWACLQYREVLTKDYVTLRCGKYRLKCFLTHMSGYFGL